MKTSATYDSASFWGGGNTDAVLDTVLNPTVDPVPPASSDATAAALTAQPAKANYKPLLIGAGAVALLWLIFGRKGA